MWLKYFNEAVLFNPPKFAHQTQPLRVKPDHYFIRIFNFYLVNYYCPANGSNPKLIHNSEQVSKLKKRVLMLESAFSFSLIFWRYSLTL